MAGVKEVGVEFYGVISSLSCSNVFPSLEILEFKDMDNWKSWRCFENVEYKGQLFPKLRKLRIRSCPELVGDLPNSLHSLEELVIEACKVEVLKRMPMLQSLNKLKISDISGRVSFNLAFPETLKSLEELEVENCVDLQHLWEKGTKIEYLGGLRLSKIRDCAKLVSLVEGEEEFFPPNLQLLDIRRCENLERLPKQLHTLKSLTTLIIIDARKLKTIGDFPENVKDVRFDGCTSLERVGEGIMVDENGKTYTGQTSCIEDLRLGTGQPASLIVPSNVVFPISVRTLVICAGYKWETQLLRSLQLQNHLSRLTYLYLDGCLLESFPATGLPIPTLFDLTLANFRNLRSLPCNFHNLTSLQYLNLDGCPKMECFPESGMPPNLQQLEILWCDTLERRPLSEWRLNRLTHLRDLAITGDMEMVSSFPPHSLPLPISLTHLNISGFKNLKSLSSDLQTLTSLQELTVYDCPKLKYLPKEGLPPSLGRLFFSDCPLIQKKCLTKYWDHVAHIPSFADDP